MHYRIYMVYVLSTIPLQSTPEVESVLLRKAKGEKEKKIKKKEKKYTNDKTPLST